MIITDLDEVYIIELDLLQLDSSDKCLDMISKFPTETGKSP